MYIFIDYISFIFSEIVKILDSIKLPGSLSLLQYFLGAIIISFIFKLVKGGTSEFEQNTNFLNGRIVSGYAAKYGNSNRERKNQIVKQNQINKNVNYGFNAGVAMASGDHETAKTFISKSDYKVGD